MPWLNTFNTRSSLVPNTCADCLHLHAAHAQIPYATLQAKLEDYRLEVETLRAKLAEMDLKRAGLASQNRILEETAAAVQARNEKARTHDPLEVTSGISVAPWSLLIANTGKVHLP